MCRLQHSLGIVWRPQTPPLTAPTSNQSEQPCRQGPGATGPSSHAGRSRRCQSIAWARGPARGATRGYWERLQRRPGTGRYRTEAGGGTCACLPWARWPGHGCPGTGARSRRAASPVAEKPCAPARLGRQRLRLPGCSPGALRPRAWPSSPRPAPASESKSETARTQRSASAGLAGSPRRLVPSSARLPGYPSPPGPVRPATGTKAVGL